MREFLYIPECTMPLSGWDLLNKLGAQINFKKGKIQVHFPEANAWQAQVYLLQTNTEESEEIPEEIKDAVYPFVSVTEKPGRAKMWNR